MVQLAHPYMTTGKTIALTRRTFVGKVISLLFFFSSVNNLVFYLPKASCCRHWGPKTSRSDGGGVSHPASQVLPAPSSFLQEMGE